MNWKNVARLIRVDMKSGRLIRGRSLTRYRESKLLTYLLYGGAVALGLLAGVGGGFVYNTIVTADPQSKALVNQGLVNLFLSLPTLILIYSLVFTMMQQIQRSGAKFSIQAPYWLPITWEEHTVASALANLLGFPLASIIFIGAAIIVLSFYINQTAYAAFTFLAVLASAFMASVITEAFRVLQGRFIGAVYKSTGRAAVWVRFAGSLLFFIVFYIVYFIIVGSGALTFVQSIAYVQTTGWFIPFLWLGMTLYSFINGLLLQALAFLLLSVLFILGLFYAAVILNRRYGLYEPPAITVTRGVYAPRTGFLGKLGFSTVEAALIRKDLKAFTRRRELMFIFVVPIVVILAPLLQAFGSVGQPVPTAASPFLFALVFLMPGAIISVFLGTIIIGQEGGAVWRLYSSPISANSLVKSKYSFMLFFSTLMTIVTGVIGYVAFHPSLRAILAALTLAFLLMFALSAISLADGIQGADFTELPRPRLIRTEWNILNLVFCGLAALAIVGPVIPAASTLIVLGSVLAPINLYEALVVSAVIAAVITFVAYRIALRNAKELLRRAEA